MDATRPDILVGLTALLDGAHLATPEELADVVLAAGRPLGWTVVLYLVDYEQRRLVPLVPRELPLRAPEDIDATLAGRAYRHVELITTADRSRLWTPLLDGVERLGVLCIDLDTPLLPGDARRGDDLRWFSHLVGHLVAAKSVNGDMLHLPRLSKPRTVASELIWSLLPPLTGACERLVISGVLEPAYEVAGDVFDYSIGVEVVDVAIADATGHSLNSALIGALALTAYRTSRRAGLTLEESAIAIDRVLGELAVDTLATGVLARLELETGRFRYVNAGHPSPLLLRDGKVVKELDQGRRILFGLPGSAPVIGEEMLEPGDWLVLYTDGVIEARDAQRRFFGLERFVDVLERSAAGGLRPPETLRRAVHTVLDHQGGVLQDDATILLLAWDGRNARALTAD